MFLVFLIPNDDVLINYHFVHIVISYFRHFCHFTPWDEPNPREAERWRPSNHQMGGIYALSEDTEMKAKLTTFTRRLEELEMRNQHEMQAVNELSASQSSCFNCQSNSHPREHCQEHAHILNQNKPPTNAPYGNTYNPNWRNHPNLSWKPKPPA